MVMETVDANQMLKAKQKAALQYLMLTKRNDAAKWKVEDAQTREKKQLYMLKNEVS